MTLNDRIRIITKDGRKWKATHSDGQITYHKTLKAAKEYKHDMGVAYFKTRKDAEEHMKKFAPKGRVVEFGRGYAVQTKTSGPYLNKAGKTDLGEVRYVIEPFALEYMELLKEGYE